MFEVFGGNKEEDKTIPHDVNLETAHVGPNETQVVYKIGENQNENRLMEEKYEDFVEVDHEAENKSMNPTLGHRNFLDGVYKNEKSEKSMDAKNSKKRGVRQSDYRKEMNKMNPEDIL